MERITAAIENSAVSKGTTRQADSGPTYMDTVLRPDILFRDNKRKLIAVADDAIACDDYKENLFEAARLNK